MGICPCGKKRKNHNYNYNKEQNNTTEGIIIRNQAQPQFNQNKFNYNNNNNFPNYNNNYQNNNNNNFNNYNFNKNNTIEKKVYSYDYYKNNYKNKNNYGYKGIPIQNNYQQNFNNYGYNGNPMQNNYQQNYSNNNINQKGEQLKANYVQLNSDFVELENKFKNIKKRNIIYYKDIKNQKECILNYKSFINELNHQINNFHDQLGVSMFGKKLEENLINQKENAQLLNELEELSYKINQLSSILETQNKGLKNLEINYKIIQEKLNEIKENKNNDENEKQRLYYVNNDNISFYLNEIEETSQELEKNKILYEKKKQEIEQDIKRIQSKAEKNVNEIKMKRKDTFKKFNINQNQSDKMNNHLFTKGSMLFSIKDFSKAQNILNSIYIFNDEDEDNYDKPELLRKNWYEICYIYDDYDIHDVNYELKAVGLTENSYFTYCSFGFVLDTNFEILAFEIDGKKTDYTLEKYCLKFDINLANLQSNKIHIRYKESPLDDKLTEGELKQKKITKVKYYGLSKRLVGQNAKFTLKNESNFEIINFENEFLIKTNENEYTWGGKVPEGGKTTIIRLSKKEAKYSFYEKNIIKTINGETINNTTLKVPFCYRNGNNKIINFNCLSKQTKKIKKDEENKLYTAQFLNLDNSKGEFIIQGELINRCKGEWICDLTDEEIESLIPEDFKFNKKRFKDIALDIIREYDEEHKNELIKIPDIAKIGKWVKNNVKYDISYSGRNDITALDTYNNLEGVCDHFTKLYNALIYSLGYQVIYVVGYAMDKSDSYGKEDAHCWSLIKINGKWLPFDATWGIFSGKFPVSHIFKQFDLRGVITKGYDYIKIGQVVIKGYFLG